jgi:hypothetical protein
MDGVPKERRGAVEDCFSCKMIGVATFGGIGTYGAYLFLSASPANKKHRLFYALFSVGAYGAAIWRGLDKI